MNILWILRLSLIVLVVAIAIGSLSDVPDMAKPPIRIDLLVHALAYATLACLAALQWPAPVKIGLGVLGYSVLLEVLQSTVPARTFDEIDIVANAVGVALGLALAARLRVVLRVSDVG